MGPERVVYGDKVINLRNHRRDGKGYIPKEGSLGYLANGEIGITVGLWGKSPKILNVEFSSQQGFTLFDFTVAISARKVKQRWNLPMR